MNLSKYTTQELEFITSHVEFFEKELEKRYITEFEEKFPYRVGDIIHSKRDNDNYILKIKKIDKRNTNIIADVIIIRDNDEVFDMIDDNWYDIVTTEWNEYVKIEDSEIFENLLKIIDKYNDDVQQLNDDTHLRLKNEIAPYDF